jgi:hypothetical protein
MGPGKCISEEKILVYEINRAGFNRHLQSGHLHFIKDLYKNQGICVRMICYTQINFGG